MLADVHVCEDKVKGGGEKQFLILESSAEWGICFFIQDKNTNN